MRATGHTHRGLLVDFGGVLTTPVAQAFQRFCSGLGVDAHLLGTLIVSSYTDPDPALPVDDLETGRISPADFAERLRAQLLAQAGVEVPAARLLERMFAGVQLCERMLRAVAAARAAGVRTGLLSNSWGHDATGGEVAGYPRERFEELFDAVVISGEVGVRKPEPAIYHLALSRLGVPAEATVFVDDLAANVEAAQELGIRGLVHRDAGETLSRLSMLLDLPESVLDTARP